MKCVVSGSGPCEGRVATAQVSEWQRNSTELVDKLAKKLSKPNKALYIAFISGSRPFFYCFNFISINMHTRLIYVMTEKGYVLLVETALF